jgi:hypothetical protein
MRLVDPGRERVEALTPDSCLSKLFSDQAVAAVCPSLRVSEEISIAPQRLLSEVQILGRRVVKAWLKETAGLVGKNCSDVRTAIDFLKTPFSLSTAEVFLDWTI